tara:strand:+ start:5561 stop:5848 length:288 start_codon:yes stop_codon:yes gene_type:complete
MIESEKLLETKLKNGTEKMGGWCIKMLSTHLTGLPDRVCLFPGGIIFFAEIKTTKKKAKKIQILVHHKIRKLGFDVHLIDTSTQINQILENVKRK